MLACRIKQLIIFLMFLLVFNTALATQDVYPFTKVRDAKRFASLTQEIRCVVCQNQNIADSNSPLATDLRNKIYEMVLAQQSNKEIKTYLVKRYGEFILLEPSLNKMTLVLWAFPFLAILIVLCFMLLIFKRQHRYLH